MAKRSKNYFKHELDAYRHPKLISLRLSGHAAAEPFYWAALSYIYEHHEALPCDTSSLDFIAFCHDMCCDFATAVDAIACLVEAQLLYRREDGSVSSERADETVGQWEETSAKRSEAGSKGGRPTDDAESKTGEIESKRKAKQPETKANGKQNGRKEKQNAQNEKQKKEEEERRRSKKGEGREGARARAPRARHGEYGNVLLGDDELAKLQAEFPDWQARIERLDGYIEQTGKRYKSHLATIRNWARRDAAQGRASPEACGSKVYGVAEDGEGWMPE